MEENFYFQAIFLNRNNHYVDHKPLFTGTEVGWKEYVKSDAWLKKKREFISRMNRGEYYRFNVDQYGVNKDGEISDGGLRIENHHDTTRPSLVATD